MVITQPTVDDFSDTTVMRVIRKIVNYICSDSGLVAQINDNDITGFTSSYTNNLLKIDATKGDGTKIPVCSLTIDGGSSTGNPYPTGITGTVGEDGNITFTVTMSSGSPLTTTINMNYFASAEDLSDLQEQVSGIKPVVTVNDSVSPPTITVAVNGTSSTANLPAGGGSSGGWVKLDINNLPIDFKDNEILMMIPKYHVSSSGISTRSFATGCYIHTITNGADMDVPITINPVYGSKTGIAYSTITNSDDYTDWNNTNTSTRLMTIYAFIDYYETSFTQVGSQNINRANIAEYFDSIYRYEE